jgi:hypothetical protein
VDPTLPTQVKRPWRSSVRTAVQITLGLVSLVPYIVADMDLSAGWAIQAVGVSTALARVMAIPAVELWLESNFSVLAAKPAPTNQEV